MDNHHPDTILEFLSGFPERTPVAPKTVGNYYWIVDEIEQAGCVPQLAHAAKAKVIMGNINKTDAKGLATLIQLGSLPPVWFPLREIRDERELPRTRTPSRYLSGCPLAKSAQPSHRTDVRRGEPHVRHPRQVRPQFCRAFRHLRRKR